MSTYFIKQGNQGPVIQATILDAAGVAENLTGTTIQFRMRRPGESAREVDAAAVVEDAPNGIVTYQLSAAQTANPGLYMVEWVKNLGLASETTHPNYSFDAVYIERSL